MSSGLVLLFLLVGGVSFRLVLLLLLERDRVTSRLVLIFPPNRMGWKVSSRLLLLLFLEGECHPDWFFLFSWKEIVIQTGSSSSLREGQSDIQTGSSSFLGRRVSSRLVLLLLEGYGVSFRLVLLL